MAKVTMGGAEYEIPPLNFKALKSIWPIVKSITNETDPMVTIEATLKVFEAAFAKSKPEMTVDFMEGELLASEIPAMQPVFMALLEDSGLIVAGSENSTPGNAESPLMGTLIDSLPNSLPPGVPEETGTPSN